MSYHYWRPEARISKGQAKKGLKALAHAHRYLLAQKETTNACAILEASQIIRRHEDALVTEAFTLGYYRRRMRAYHNCAVTGCQWRQPLPWLHPDGVTVLGHTFPVGCGEVE